MFKSIAMFVGVVAAQLPTVEEVGAKAHVAQNTVVEKYNQVKAELKEGYEAGKSNLPVVKSNKKPSWIEQFKQGYNSVQ